MKAQTASEVSRYEHARCERARLARDPRFDGLFYIAVKTTGIYCRPVCPAPTAKSSNVLYFEHAAAAASAGFRPCLRCRPELSPDDQAGRARDELADRVLARVHDGALDTVNATALAAEFAINERQLRRMFVARYGVTPQAAAATHRVHVAKQLLTETRLPVTEIAYAAGYASLRRFNQAFVSATRLNPTQLRKQGTIETTSDDVQRLRLAYRPPYSWPDVLAFLARRALAPIEQITDTTYTRTLPEISPDASISVQHRPDDHALELSLRHVPTRLMPQIAQRVRRMFDLDADPAAIDGVLAGDVRIAASTRARPGLRVPVGFDPFETAIRAVLGQRISVAATRTLLSRMIGAEQGAPRFPDAATLASRDPANFGVPSARAAAVLALSRAVADGHVHFRAGQSLDAFVATLVELPGIGPWTAHYIAMRALGHPDAFPVGDLTVRRALGNPRTRDELAIAEHWRPWRAYAVLHLWTMTS